MFAWLLFQQNLAMGGGAVVAVVDVSPVINHAVRFRSTIDQAVEARNQVNQPVEVRSTINQAVEFE